MIGVVVPAHDEADHIGDTLVALALAARHPDLAGEPVEVLVVLDSCGDATGDIARACGIDTLAIEARNVGRARAAGATDLLARGARWLAFTDADTRVAPDWLVRQLELDADVVCGSIGVEDWSAHGTQAGFIRDHFARTYQDADGHRHIHGANLGVSAEAYLRVGGFRPLACSEDVALVAALQACGARIAWSAAPRVTTSARANARARGGFGDTLLAVIAAGLAVTAVTVAAQRVIE
ncbi:MAG: glycosyltransferase [Variovorax sp.]|nr:MAG: glycosyltransferase [Variovorax sp.]